MAALTQMADSLYEAINIGDTDAVMDLLKKGANVNILPTCGRTVLGRAAQLGHVGIVCLLLDAEKFYTTPEEEEVDTEAMFSCVTTAEGSNVSQTSTTSPTYAPVAHSSAQAGAATSAVWPTTLPLSSTTSASSFRPSIGSSLRSPQQTHKCCSPSIDSETCTCSDELWGLDLSDTNQHSDWEPGRRGHDLPNNNNEEKPELEIEVPFSAPGRPHNTSQYTPSNIGYYVYEYREEDEDTERKHIVTGEETWPGSTPESASKAHKENRFDRVYAARRRHIYFA